VERPATETNARRSSNPAIHCQQEEEIMRVVSTLIASLLILANAAFAVPAAAAIPRCHGKPATIVATGVNPVLGTNGDDVIVGTNDADTIYGFGGIDLICGRDGKDTILPGPANDTVYAGDGDDLIIVLDQLAGEDFGNDTLNGEAGNDTIRDGSGANFAYGGPGSDFVSVVGRAYGDSGDDRHVAAAETSPGAKDGFASGGSGSDGFGAALNAVSVSGGVADGGSGNDVLLVGRAGDTAIGGSGSDYLKDFSLSNGAVTLNGGSATDTCDEDGGNDTLISCETVV
jgi:Ca2+-binding RTX toxin-like protein